MLKLVEITEDIRRERRERIREIQWQAEESQRRPKALPPPPMPQVPPPPRGYYERDVYYERDYDRSSRNRYGR